MQRLDDIKKKSIIDNAVEMGMVGRRKSSMWQKQLVAAAAVVMIGIPILGFTFPALAQHIPIIGGIFGREDLHQQERFVEMADDVLDVGHTQKRDGFAVTLSEVFIDGGRMYVAYHIESTGDALLATENELHELEDADQNADGLVSFGHDMPIFVDGLEINTSQTIYEIVAEDRLSKTVIFGVEATEISEGDTVTAKLTGVSRPSGGVGVWDFNFHVPAFSGIRLADELINHVGQEAMLYNMRLSASGLSINSRGELPLELSVVDDLGNSLELRSRSGGSEDGEFFAQTTFEIPHTDANQVIVTPIYVNFFFEVPEDEAVSMEIDEYIDEYDLEETTLKDLILEIFTSYEPGREVSVDMILEVLVDRYENNHGFLLENAIFNALWEYETTRYIELEPIIIDLP